jgi:hypothetical protein
MASQEDVRRIALALPETTENPNAFAFSVRGKGFAWVWLERPKPKARRVPNPQVLAIRVAHDLEKQALLAVDSTKFFTEPHYDGYPAVLVRLPAVSVAELEDLLTDAWRVCAPKRLAATLKDGGSRLAVTTGPEPGEPPHAGNGAHTPG